MPDEEVTTPEEAPVLTPEEVAAKEAITPVAHTVFSDDELKESAEANEAAKEPEVEAPKEEEPKPEGTEDYNPNA